MNETAVRSVLRHPWGGARAVLAVAIALAAGCVGGGSGVASPGGVAQAAGSEQPGGAPLSMLATRPAASSFRVIRDVPRFATVRLGGGRSLTLDRVRVSVEVEGFRARTVVDHIYFNPHAEVLEGTFQYPLPTGASVAYYAMFLGTGTGTEAPAFFRTDAPPAPDTAGSLDGLVAAVDDSAWGELRVGRLVPAASARAAYTATTRPVEVDSRMVLPGIDPALVEEVSPNTFEARVYPIQPQRFHRVIIAYEESLPMLAGGELEYTLALPNAALGRVDFELNAARATVDGARVVSPARGLTVSSEGARVAVRGAYAGGSPGTVALRLRPAGPPGPVDVLVGRSADAADAHLVARVRGAPPAGESTPARQAVFLVDTSLSSARARAAVDRQLLNGILAGSPEIARFQVISFDAGARWLSDAWIANDAAGRARALAGIDAVLREGATDVEAALAALAHPPAGVEVGPERNVDVFVLSDGAASWGVRDAGVLASLLPQVGPFRARFFAYRTGLGENLPLLQALTRDGGLFACLDVQALARCATAHRAPGLKVDALEVVDARTGRSVVQDLVSPHLGTRWVAGSELVLAARVLREGPALVRVRGTVAGRAQEASFPVDLRVHGLLAPRAWAELAIAELLATGDAALEPLALALSQHYRVPSARTAFVVLETDADYERFDLREQRAERAGRPIGALVAAAATPDPALHLWHRVRRALVLAGVTPDAAIEAAVSALEARRAPPMFEPAPAVTRDEVSNGYRSGLEAEDGVQDGLVVEEALRRTRRGAATALRAISSLVEQRPTDTEVARAAGAWLLSLGAAREAAWHYLDVLDREPAAADAWIGLVVALAHDRPAPVAAACATRPIAFYAFAIACDAAVRTVRAELGAEPAAGWLDATPWRAHLVAGSMAIELIWNTAYTDLDLSGRPAQGAGDVRDGFGPERAVLAGVAASHAGEVEVRYVGSHGARAAPPTHALVVVARTASDGTTRIDPFAVFLPAQSSVAQVAFGAFGSASEAAIAIDPPARPAAVHD